MRPDSAICNRGVRLTLTLRDHRSAVELRAGTEIMPDRTRNRQGLIRAIARRRLPTGEEIPGPSLLPSVPTSTRHLTGHSSNKVIYLPLRGAPLPNRTVDLLLTISTLRCDRRTSCTDATRERTDRTDRAGNSPAPSPRASPRRTCSCACPARDGPHGLVNRYGHRIPGRVRAAHRTAERCAGRSGLSGRRGRLIAVEPGDDRTPPARRAQFRGHTRRRRSPPPRAAVDGDRALGAAASAKTPASTALRAPAASMTRAANA